MNVNGVTSQSVSTYRGTSSAKTSEAKKENAAENTSADSGVIYESSAGKEAVQPTKKYTPNPELVNKLKAEVENRASQLQSLVEKMISQQTVSYGKANDIWSILRSGNFTVDAETKAQAQADIAEDGYFGVKQTSERILDFAKALTGGDPSQMEKMREAFEKGFKQAEKTWGGELPEISKRTYDAVMQGFDKLKEQE